MLDTGWLCSCSTCTSQTGFSGQIQPFFVTLCELCEICEICEVCDVRELFQSELWYLWSLWDMCEAVISVSNHSAGFPFVPIYKMCIAWALRRSCTGQSRTLSHIQLSKWGMCDTNLCTFCESSVETVKHLLWECDFAQIIWIKLFFFCKVFGGDMSFFGATGTPVLDFWWRFLWVSKPEWVLPYSLFFAEANVMYIPQDSPLVLHLPTSWQPACSRSLPHMHVQRWDLAQIRTCNRMNRRRTRYHCASDPVIIWIKLK